MSSQYGLLAQSYRIGGTFRGMRNRTVRSSSILVLLLAMTRSGAAEAAENMALEEMAHLNEGATKDLQARDVNGARKKLDKALGLVGQTGVERHPTIARTHLLDGVLLATGLGDRESGCAAFREALRIDPRVKIGRPLSSPELEKLMAGAKAKTCGNNPAPRMAAPAPSGGGTAEDAEPDLPLRVETIDCPSPDARQGKEILVRCATAPSLKVVRAVLQYRPPRKQEFVAVPMARSHKGWWTGTIPAADARSTSLQFYVEAHNEAGKPVASSGRADSPEILTIEQPKREPATSEACKENPLLCAPEPEKRERHAYWVGLGVGWGLGLFLGDPEVRKDLVNDVQHGFSFDFIPHVVPEVGFHLSDDLAISIQTRHQYIYQPAKYENRVARGAHAVLVRGMYFLNPPDKKLRLYVAGILGGGEGFRLTFVPDNALPDMKDSSRGGPVVLGGGAGVMFAQSDSWGWTAGANLLFGLPSFNAVLDLNFGAYFSFGTSPFKQKKTADDGDEEPSTPPPTPKHADDE